MTIFEALAISKANQLHIRRASWPASKWVIAWRGIVQTVPVTGRPYFTRGSEYGRADLLADDWTTVPAPLAACPVTPTEPIGGGDPIGGFPGLPFEPPPGFPPPPGAPGGGGGGSPSLPPPKPDGTGLSVTFAGITGTTLSTNYYDISADNLNGPFPLDGAGAGVWTSVFKQGYISFDGGATPTTTFQWTITVTKVGQIHAPSDLRIYYTVRLSSIGLPSGGSPSGGFTEATAGRIGQTINNLLTSSADGAFFGGTAVLSGG